MSSVNQIGFNFHFVLSLLTSTPTLQTIALIYLTSSLSEFFFLIIPSSMISNSVCFFPLCNPVISQLDQPPHTSNCSQALSFWCSYSLYQCHVYFFIYMKRRLVKSYETDIGKNAFKRTGKIHRNIIYLVLNMYWLWCSYLEGVHIIGRWKKSKADSSRAYNWKGWRSDDAG